MLKLIVSIDDLSPDVKSVFQSWGESCGVQIKNLRESQWFAPIVLNSGLPTFFLVEEMGRKTPVQPIPATPEQIATICYISVR